eukprot:scaffold98469_cov63-Cyclotella_meneghiniana.AAC.13
MTDVIETGSMDVTVSTLFHRSSDRGKIGRCGIRCGQITVSEMVLFPYIWVDGLTRHTGAGVGSMEQMRR